MHKHNFDKAMMPFSSARSSELVANFALDFLEAIDSPRALAVHILFREKEYSQLVRLESPDPSRYVSAYSYADDYQATKLFSKYQDFAHADLNPEKAALESFFECETLNKLTNEKFQELELDPSKWDPMMHDTFVRARRKIAKVLGTPDLVRISNGFGWGPGSTTSTTGNRTSAYMKFKARLDVTSNALIMGHCCINSTPSWVNCQIQSDNYPSTSVSLTREAFNVVRGNEIVLVPKDAKTRRMIAKEPLVNSYLQKGFGKEIRRRLAIYAGLDLSDQGVNQHFARIGSLNNSLATLDMKNASNMIATKLVQYLLPPSWFVLLDSIRSKQGLLKSSNAWLHYQMFSSSGNAYTFELETLIFWALSEASKIEGDEFASVVYGDDIIVSSMSASRTVEVLEFAGFRVNTAKSFIDGPFRESCGHDYFLGTNVRPFFLKRKLSNVQELYKLANSIRRYSHLRNFNYGCDRRFRSTWDNICRGIPETFRKFTVPFGYGDSGLMVNFDECCPKVVRSPRGGMEGFICKVVHTSPVKELMKDSHAGYTAKLYESGSEQPSLNFHSLRNMTKLKIGFIHVHEWYNLGEWD